MKRGKSGHTGTQGEHHVKAEAEAGIMCLSVKIGQRLPTPPEKVRKNS